MCPIQEDESAISKWIIEMQAVDFVLFQKLHDFDVFLDFREMNELLRVSISNGLSNSYSIS